jgi:transcriptional regulator with XRE-family HTH domain
LIEPRHTLGSRLKETRERTGVTLESIARATKIKRSLLAGLEKNDVSEWPTGIFRRAFVREYARALGLPPEQTLVEFLQTFPEGDSVESDPSTPASELRLTLAVEPHRRAIVAARQIAAAMLDLGFVMLVGGVVAGFGEHGFWSACGVVALIYYPLSVACLGRTLFAYWMSPESAGRRTHRRADRHPRDLRVVARRAQLSYSIPHQDGAGTDAAHQRRSASS